MKLVVTIYEESCDAAIDAIRALDQQHDMVEVRAERFPSIDLQAIRNATAKPIILTYRNARVPDARAALNAGIDYVDVEWRDDVVVDVPERTVLSHHDYEGMRNVGTIMSAMRARGCAFTKLAATPRTFAENEQLLSLLPGTVIGMGERGLYSRILAPFKGSELAFVAGSNVAAPSQLTLERALEVYGGVEDGQSCLSLRGKDPGTGRIACPPQVFAIVGDPAGHSLSPVIHNRLFREKRVPAAYTIASFESFDEIRDAFLKGEPCGLSVTTPFKEDAFRVEAEMGENAKRAKAVNTLVNIGGRIISDNTDVDGFAALIRGNEAAVLGRGPTARAAMVALENARIPFTMFTRDNMHELRGFRGDLIINTLPPEADVAIPPCVTYLEAAYSGAPRAVEAEFRISGLDLLHAQAVRQHQLFMRVFDGL